MSKALEVPLEDRDIERDFLRLIRLNLECGDKWPHSKVQGFMIQITERDGSVTFTVRVQPRASRTALVGEIDGAIKIRLAAPPVDGAANLALLRFLSRLLGISESSIEVISGARSRTKIIRVRGITSESCSSALIPSR